MNQHGYIEDLDLINVSDILKDVSLNSSSLQAPLYDRVNTSDYTSRLDKVDFRRSHQFPLKVEEYKNIEKLNDTKENILPEIPNPVGYLQELCVKKQLNPPVYGILRQEGPSHNPTFTTFCRVGEYYREASSNNKKKGKDTAARLIILCLRESCEKVSANGSDEVQNETVTSSSAEASDERLVDTSVESSREVPKQAFTRTINYVGFLQELCVRKQLPPPIYGTEMSTGTPNNPSFYIFCKVGSYKKVGIASNKKSAKHLAAEQILNLLEIPANTDKSVEQENTQADNKEILQQAVTTETCTKLLSESTLDDLPKIPNPVGHLQELCVKYHLSPPVYGIEQVNGPPHCPTFITFCKVENFYEIASSSNKKRGKEMAALKILKCLAESKTVLNLI